MRIAAFDPGRNVGFALLDESGALLDHAVVDRAGLDRMQLAADVVVVGDGTGSGELIATLVERGLDPVRVDEVGTTLEGRHLYFRDHPPTGIMRLVPVGMRSPPRPIDDYAAYAIGLRWLVRQNRIEGSSSEVRGEGGP